MRRKSNLFAEHRGIIQPFKMHFGIKALVSFLFFFFLPLLLFFYRDGEREREREREIIVEIVKARERKC